MIKVLFFAQLRDVLNTAQLDIDLTVTSINSVSQLRQHLVEKGELWQEYLHSGRTLVAVNQTMSDDSAELHAGDEVAFFPPVTGG